MKNTALRYCLIFLCVTFLSCSTHKLLFSDIPVTIEMNKNSILQGDSLLVRIDTLLLSFRSKKFITTADSLSRETGKYATHILKECGSISDTIIAIANNIVIVKNSPNNYPTRANYQYYRDYENWVTCNVGYRKLDSISFTTPFSFFRKVYIVRKKNRVILKDIFADISVIYIVQGKDKTSKVYITSVWNPVDFNSFMTTASYIQREFDPISIDISEKKQ